MDKSGKAEHNGFCCCARAIKDTVIVTGIIILCVCIAAFVMGQVWNLICWFRAYGSVSGIIDQGDVLTRRDFGSGWLNWVADKIDIYNVTFSGNARFGSGIGIISGAFASLILVSKKMPDSWQKARIRFMAGAIAGLMIGGRTVLTFTSDPLPFIAGLVLGALTVGSVTLSTHEKLPHLRKLGWSDGDELVGE